MVRNRKLLLICGVSLSALLLAALLCGCGGGAGDTGGMMLKIVSPSNGANCSGNVTVAATMLNPAMATTVKFIAGGGTFSTVTIPQTAMSARLDTLSRGIPNGPVTVVVQTTGNVYTASRTINVNNPTSIYVQDTSGNVGDYVTVHVKLNNYASAAGYTIFLNYDTDKLALNAGSVVKGAGIPASSSFTPNTSTPGILNVAVTGTAVFQSGEMFTANFQIKNPSAHGSTNDITVPLPALKNASGGAITVVGVPGSVTTN